MVTLAVIGVMLVAANPGEASASARPTVSDRSRWGGCAAVSTTMFDLGRVGYEQSEYFLSGRRARSSPRHPSRTMASGR